MDVAFVHMCGIVGLFAKSPELEQRLGEHLAAMLVQLSDRGPDSAGVAIYSDAAPVGASKLTLFSPDPLENWNAVRDTLAEVFGGCSDPRVRASHAVFVVDAEAAEAEEWMRSSRSNVRVMSAGRAIEIYKETGSPRRFVEQFALTD
jgi:methylamine---glutamate N-methyltransferase subunit A